MDHCICREERMVGGGGTKLWVERAGAGLEVCGKGWTWVGRASDKHTTPTCRSQDWRRCPRSSRCDLLSGSILQPLHQEFPWAQSWVLYLFPSLSMTSTTV